MALAVLTDAKPRDPLCRLGAVHPSPSSSLRTWRGSSEEVTAPLWALMMGET